MATNLSQSIVPKGLPKWCNDKESACRCRRCKRCRFNPRVRNVPWRSRWQPTPVFLPGKPQWTEEPGRLQSMGSQRVGHDWAHTHTMSQNQRWKPHTGLLTAPDSGASEAAFCCSRRVSPEWSWETSVCRAECASRWAVFGAQPLLPVSTLFSSSASKLTSTPP